MRPALIRHLSGEPIGRFPVWAMRQAGRYLPEYRAIRSRHSFWQMVTSAEIAADVSLTPLGVLPVDGIIFFSDILTLPYGLGVGIEMREGVGPVTVQPLRSIDDFSIFEHYRPSEHTPFVSEALKKVRERTPEDIAVLGFAGAPWTVGTYLVEGKPGRKFEAIRGWMNRDPADLALALRRLAQATVSYLRSQVDSGAQFVQLFDTWLSAMPADFFRTYYLPILNEIFDALRDCRVPRVYFSKGAHHLMGDFAELEIDVLSVDELRPMREVDRLLNGKFSLQGNLDPLLLFESAEIVRRQTRLLVAEARTLSKPAVLNLGHGILPGTPPENVRAFFEEARQLWL